ncbi:MAG TPA: hypothetical protein VGQ52_13830 [Gemmatimonadaceae bacterium]|nr:hypothetical protein [Gemmatimonadaceae bacterium]
MSKRTSKTEHGTALEAFEQEKAQISRLLGQIQHCMHEYDRDVSSVPGGHQDWSHAGTLTNVREALEGAMESLDSARANTRKRRSPDSKENLYVTRSDGRRVRVTVPTDKE